MNTNAVIVGVILVALMVGGFIYYNNQSGTIPGNATSTPIVNTPDPIPTPESQASAPSVVSDASVAPSNSTAVVTGKVTPNGAPTTYWYEYGESASLGKQTSSQAIGSGWSAIPSPGYITGLRANTSYYFRLSAKNSYGTVNGATQTFSTNNNPPAQGTPPSASTNAAGDVARNSATLHGRVDPHASQTTFWFEYGVTTDFGRVSAFQSAGTGSGAVAVSAAVSGLNPQTKYYFRVNAQNQYGTVNGSTQSFTTNGPPAGVAPSATTRSTNAIGTSTATMRGTVDPNGTETKYWFEYSTDSLLGSVLLKTTAQKSAGAGTNPTSVDSDVSGLNPNTTYYVRLVAQSGVGVVRGDRETFKTK